MKKPTKSGRADKLGISYKGKLLSRELGLAPPAKAKRSPSQREVIPISGSLSQHPPSRRDLLNPDELIQSDRIRQALRDAGATVEDDQ